MQECNYIYPTKGVSNESTNRTWLLLISGVIVALLMGIVAGFFGGIVAGLALLVITFTLIGISDYRAGVLVAIILLPLSGTHILPREIFGIVGFNPLNLTLVTSTISLLYMAVFHPKRILIPSCSIYFLAYICIMVFATILGTLHVSSIPGYYLTIQMINFNNAAGYVRDIFFKPMLILVTAFMLAIVIRNAHRPTRYLIPLFSSALILPIVSIAYVAMSGMSLHRLASSESRTVLNVTGMHANELGLMFNMAFALTLFCLFGLPGTIRRVLLFIAAFLLMSASVLTFSRGAFVGLITVGIYFLCTQRKFKTLLVGVAFVPALMFLVPDAVMERATTGAQTHNMQEISAGRVDNIWLPLMPEVLANPVIGHGLSSILWSDAARKGAILKVGHPHSAYIGILMDMGLIGAFVAFLFFRNMWRLFMQLVDGAREPVWRAFFRGGTACILLLLVQGVTDDHFTPTFPQTFLWLSYGIGIGLVGRKDTVNLDLTALDQSVAKV